ncbi:MAG: hypothetical protein M5U28_33510 [Sandaracinaceae bacterium]|nr:hypothetical protein [Sandaracinaceae bacterium]
MAYPVASLGADTITTGAVPEGIAAGDEVLLISLQGSPSAYRNVGTYESFYVTSVSSSTITVHGGITGTYGVADDNSDLTGQRVVVQRVPNYTDVTVNSGVTLTASPWNGSTGGIVAFRASGTATIMGRVSADATGYRRHYPAFGGGGESFCAATGPGQCTGGSGGTNGPKPGGPAAARRSAAEAVRVGSPSFGTAAAPAASVGTERRVDRAPAAAAAEPATRGSPARWGAASSGPAPAQAAARPAPAAAEAATACRISPVSSSDRQMDRPRTRPEERPAGSCSSPPTRSSSEAA